MTKALAAIFMSFALFSGVPHAHAQNTPALTLSLIRAVRLSNTSLTLSFKTSEVSIGQLTYTEPDNSKVQLTDSAPQTDHLFTMTGLSPSYGYTFTLTATHGTSHSNSYAVLLSPDSVGPSGGSMFPSAQVSSPAGDFIGSVSAASTTTTAPSSIVPWWVFVLLFVLVIGGWLGRKWYRRSHQAPLY